MMKTLTLLLLALPVICFSQSKTTKAFHDDHEDAFVLFFYSNTLKMLNQDDNPEFEELIKDIDKMKFIRVDKAAENVDKDDYKELVASYYDEDFEDLMTMRHEGMNVNAYIQEEDGVTTGIVLLMQDNESLSILDIKGSVAISKLATLISKVQNFN
ncbi:DUF4252 domain-containing protein [Fulvivirga lutea]|uniref:DUF4252 domain-containing protein n=1 Tax=Fulvivirga lutea TaxID=2810512 RepID=A0A974WES6_9BACT|nr:DUF4252 domain-containing protein [Fulvivirga lutea]QSE96083.1 DUF4252 domain-containing protein [Fulvivirga lutea]